MANVKFYLQSEDQIDGQSANLHLACLLATEQFSRKQWCYVLCDSKQQAEQFDELLWQRPAERFVPHNLSGEGPANGTPVEICWDLPSGASRATLINISSKLPEALRSFRNVFDFVPVEETAKQQARERYKQYRAAGCQLTTEQANTLYESSDG